MGAFQNLYSCWLQWDQDQRERKSKAGKEASSQLRPQKNIEEPGQPILPANIAKHSEILKLPPNCTCHTEFLVPNWYGNMMTSGSFTSPTERNERILRRSNVKPRTAASKAGSGVPDIQVYQTNMTSLFDLETEPRMRLHLNVKNFEEPPMAPTSNTRSDSCNKFAFTLFSLCGWALHCAKSKARAGEPPEKPEHSTTAALSCSCHRKVH